MSAADARAIAESYSADAENASHLESALNESQKLRIVVSSRLRCT